MNSLYRDNADSATGTATALDALAGADEDRILKKILIGKPVAGASITVFHNNNAYNAATTNIALKYTFPTFGAGTPASDMIDLTAGDAADDKKNGLLLTGSGSVYTTSAMQVTFLFDNPDA